MMNVIDLCDDGADSHDDDDVANAVQWTAASRDVGVPNFVFQTAVVGGGGGGGGGGGAGADTQPLKRGRGRPRKTLKTSRFGEVSDSRFTATATEIYCEVAGKPSPKKRAAFGRNSNRYNPSKVEEQDFAEVVKGLCHRHLQSVPKFHPDVLLVVHITFYFPCKTDGSSSLIREADIDNLCKFVLDALNNVLYADDRQIVELTASKCFDTAGCLSGRTTISIAKKN